VCEVCVKTAQARAGAISVIHGVLCCGLFVFWMRLLGALLRIEKQGFISE